MSEMWWQGTLVGASISPWYPVSFLVGAALIALGMTMRPEGRKIVWSWASGYAENCTPVGKAVFFLGLGLHIFGMTGLPHWLVASLIVG